MKNTNTLARRWGAKIRAARRAKSLSLEALAEAVGIDAGHLSRAERGLAGLGDGHRIRISRELGQRVEELFDYPRHLPGERVPRCGQCGGRGTIPNPSDAGGNPITCPICNGTGRVGTQGEPGA